MGAVTDRRTTSSTTITKTASLLLGEFSPIKEQQEEATTTTTTQPPSPSPPRDAFYDDVPDIVRVFALDYDRLYRSFCQRTALYAFNAVFKIWLVCIFAVDPSQSTLFKVFAIATFLFGFIFWSAHVIAAPHSWRGIAGQHVALTSTGIRYDRAYPSRETIHVRTCVCVCCVCCVMGGASLVGRFLSASFRSLTTNTNVVDVVGGKTQIPYADIKNITLHPPRLFESSLSVYIEPHHHRAKNAAFRAFILTGLFEADEFVHLVDQNRGIGPLGTLFGSERYDSP
jgi:hypothetical protein